MSPSAVNAEPRVNAPLLVALVEAREPWPIDALAARLGASPSAVLGDLESLREAGSIIDVTRETGVYLHKAGLSAWLDYLQHRFGCRRPMHVYRATSSTQDVCRRLVAARGRAAHGAMVVADAQTAGRGRLGRVWQAPAGQALTFSLVHHPAHAPQAVALDRLTLATSVAMARALDDWLKPLGERVAIKWPNDLYMNQSKVGGILVETVNAAVAPAAIVGVGVNINQDASALAAITAANDRTATSLRQTLGRGVSRLAVLGAAIDALDLYLNAPTDTALLDEWRARSTLLHRTVALQCAGERVDGQVIDLHPHEGLIVRTTSGALTHLPAANTTVL